MATYSRRVPKPNESRKRKERDDFVEPNPKPPPTPPAANEAISNNRILSGYLADEFLTQATLFGQKWDPDRAEAVPVKRRAPTEPPPVKQKYYEQVAKLLKSEETKIAGIVNPSQLVRWLQM